MKLLSVALFFFLAFNVFSQDTLVYRNGDKKVVNVLKSTPETVEFKYPNEDLINTEYKKALQKIIFKSGRVEDLSAQNKLPVIDSEDDWEKVILTSDPNDVVGLTSIGEVKGKSSVGGMASKAGYEKARKKIKQEAAKKGAPIVLVQKDKYGYSGAIIVGIAYK